MLLSPDGQAVLAPDDNGKRAAFLALSELLMQSAQSRAVFFKRSSQTSFRIGRVQ